jgi:hypothetical protein
MSVRRPPKAVTIPPVESGGALLLPLADDSMGPLPPTFPLGDDLRLVRKAELHLTLLGTALGRALLECGLADMAVMEAEVWPWKIEKREVYLHLSRTVPGKPFLDTVVAMVDAPLAAFHQHLARLVPARHAAIVATLREPPPAHVTLYTSDPEGALGIGIHSQAELAAALALALAPGRAAGLRAFRL